MNTERLLRLAALLEADAANPTGVKFDLNGWAKPVTKRWADNEHFPPNTVAEVSCNTNACALGLAAISGVFKDEGLTYEITEFGNLIPKHGQNHAFEAATSFFDLPVAVRVRHDFSYQLFDPDFYPREALTGREGELAVASRIRELVADGEIDYPRQR